MSTDTIIRGSSAALGISAVIFLILAIANAPWLWIILTGAVYVVSMATLIATSCVERKRSGEEQTTSTRPVGY